MLAGGAAFALSELGARLGAVFSLRQPLQIVDGVATAQHEGDAVVNHVAGAASAMLPGARAGIRFAEFSADARVARDGVRAAHGERGDRRKQECGASAA